MMPPLHVDGVWDRKGLLYNPYMANMLTRRQYYLMQRLIRTDVVSLPEDCHGQWAGAWCMGGGACGDESVVPHKGLLAGPLKMSLVRTPHPTGIKLWNRTAWRMQHGGMWLTCTCTLLRHRGGKL